MADRRNPYFKFYPADFMGGVRGMTAQEVGVYTMLLCRMYEEDGPIGDDAFRLSTYCGMREKTFIATLDKLVRLGKIERRDGMLYNERAIREISSRSDSVEVAIRAGKTSAEKRQQKQSAPQASVDAPLNHTDTDTDTEGLGKPNPVASDNHKECFDHFNAVAASVGWPIVQKISPSRRTALSQRLRDVGGIDGWCSAIDRASLSPLLTGKNGRGWVADFDWLCKPANFTKLMEGNYDARPANNTSESQPRRAGDGSATVAAFAAVAARYRTEPQ